MFAKKSLGPDPRSKSIVEAEKGETVLTNKSRGLNNIVEMYNIKGEKHSKNGTPLDLPVDDEGTGASFIFSDKLFIDDPAVIELFGSKKKKATYAEISKQYVSVINDSKLLLLDKNSDDYTKKSAESNIETAMTQLNKLKVLQESVKGFPNGMPTGTENFFKDMGVNPEDIIAPNENIEQAAVQAQQKAMGGLVRKVFLQKKPDGGVIGDPPKKYTYNLNKDVLTLDELKIKYPDVYKNTLNHHSGDLSYFNNEPFSRVPAMKNGKPFTEEDLKSLCVDCEDQHGYEYEKDNEGVIYKVSTGRPYRASLDYYISRYDNNFNNKIPDATFDVFNPAKIEPVKTVETINNKVTAYRNQTVMLPDGTWELRQVPYYTSGEEGSNYGRSLYGKTNVNYDDLTPQEQETLKYKGARATFSQGGIVRKVFLPKAERGGELKWGYADKNARIQYEYIANTLNTDDNFKEALWLEYQNVLKEDDRFSSGYAKNKNVITRKDKNQVFNDYLDFQKRNLMLRSHGIKVKESDQNAMRNEKGIKQASNSYLTTEAKKLNVDMPSMDDAAAQQLSFHAFENVVKNKDKYPEQLKQVMQPFYANLTGAIGEKGVNAYESRGLSLADGAYTNTTAGEISLFDPEKIFKKVETNPDLTFEEKDNGVQQVDTKGTKDNVATNKTMLENPLGFRSQDIRNLNRAIASRAGLRKYSPFMVSPELQNADAAYYSPERAIASVMEQVNSAEDVSKAFGDAQGATAGALALSGNAFSATADIIGNYADKNVGLFNNIANANAERASKQNAMDADIRTRLFADNVDMSEKFRRGVEMAKDKITMMQNTAEKNMSDLYNLNRLNEQAKIDPLTGLVYITNEKELKGKSSSDVDAMGEEFKSFRNTLPKDISNDLALKAFMGFKTGKIITDDATNNVTPNELQ